MLENFVLFEVGGAPWTFAGVCLAFAGALFVVWLVLLPAMARRHGTIRRMTSDEAAKLSMVGITPSYDAPRPVVWGPAAGKQWRIDLSIGDLRSVWRRGDHAGFFGSSAFLALLPVAVALAGLATAIFADSALFLVFSGCALLMIAILAIMMWAAVYTQLE
jgi:hypothetical protein